MIKNNKNLDAKLLELQVKMGRESDFFFLLVNPRRMHLRATVVCVCVCVCVTTLAATYLVSTSQMKIHTFVWCFSRVAFAEDALFQKL